MDWRGGECPQIAECRLAEGLVDAARVFEILPDHG